MNRHLQRTQLRGTWGGLSKCSELSAESCTGAARPPSLSEPIGVALGAAATGISGILSRAFETAGGVAGAETEAEAAMLGTGAAVEAGAGATDACHAARCKSSWIGEDDAFL